MATRTWGGTTGAWFSAANWITAPPDANNFPQPGDSVFINTGTPALDDSQGAVNQLHVSLGSANSASPAVLLLSAATLGSDFILTSGSSDRFARLVVTGTSGTPATIDAGTITADAAGDCFKLTFQPARHLLA